jgi:hypothetical protein
VKRWALVVVALYFLILVVLTVPVAMLAFAPQASVKDVAEAYLNWPYWLWVVVMVLAWWLHPEPADKAEESA